MTAFVLPVEFHRDETGYRRWTRRHADGFVLNLDTADVGAWRDDWPWAPRLHRATCRYVTGTPSNGRAWTEVYAKVCCESLDVLLAAAQANGVTNVRACKACRPEKLD